MGKKLIKLLVIGIFAFLGFGISVKAIATPHSLYLDNVGLVDLEIYKEQATLKVSGVYSSETFKAYKILDVYYNSETNEMLYGFTESFYYFLWELDLGINSDTPFTVDDYFALTSGDITSGSTVSTSELDTLVSRYTAYIKENSIEGLDMTVSDSTASLTTEAGSYLVLPTQTNRVFAVMVGNLDMYADGTEWKVNDETIVAKVSDVAIFRGNMNSSGDSISEVIIDREYISIIEIAGPTYPTNATNKKFSVSDLLDAGITFLGLSTMEMEASGVIYTNNNGVFTDSAGNTVATATFIDQVLTVEFNADYINTTDIVVSYTTKLNSDAIIGWSGNNAYTTLLYSNDPYGTGTITAENTEDIQTFGLQIYKYDVDTNEPLSGATFEIYTDEELTDLVGTFTTDEMGIGRFDGITGFSTFYLKEVKAPTGYKLLRDYVVFSSMMPKAIEDEVSIEVPDGYRMQYIANEKMGILPVTGGIGTVIFTIVGLLVIAGSISFITIYRSKKNQENFQV